MRRQHARLHSPAAGRDFDIIGYGHAGPAVLVFPSSEGSVQQYEDFGMVGELAPLIEAGRLRLYCVGSYDSESWYGRHRPAHERAWRHTLYEDWIMNQAIPAIARDVGDPHVRLDVTGCSFGAFHSALFTLKHPHRFRHALCMSGVYDIRFLLQGHHDDWVYFNNPMEFVPNLNGGLLEEIRRRVFITLVCGQGNWENRCVESTTAFWKVLSERQVPNYMDLWGHDVAHDWPWWRKQIVYFMSHIVNGTLPWLRT
jgi:esterase/lipase superfamily enzyme